MTPVLLEADVLQILAKGLALSAVLVALGLLLLRGRSAQFASLYWRGTLTGLLLIPLLSLYLPLFPVALPGSEADNPAAGKMEEVVPANAGDASKTLVMLPVEELGAPVAENSEESIVAPVSSLAPERGGPHWARVIGLGLWLAGFLLVTGRWLSSWLRVRKRVRESRPETSAGWHEDLESFGAPGKRVTLVSSDRVRCPMVFGVWRPVLLLPRDATEWDRQRRLQVLGHELSHIRRLDALFLGVARLAVAIHWINPFAWLVARRLRFADERVADDAVLAQGDDPAVYASLLARFARRVVEGSDDLPVVAPSMASPSTVRTRVQKVLDARQKRGAPRRITRLALGLLIGAAVLTVGGLTMGTSQAQELVPPEPERVQPDEAAVVNGNEEVIRFKIRNTTIPVISFEESTLAEAIDFLRARSSELDTWEPDPNKKGLNFVIVGGELADRVIPKLQLRNVPLEGVLEFVCELTRTNFRIGPHSIAIRDGAPVPKPIRVKAAGEEAEQAGPVTQQKLSRIIIPAVHFEDTTLEEAVDFLRQRSRELDVLEPEPEKKGINYVIRGKELSQRKVKAMKLMNVPLATAMGYLCEATNTKFKLDEFAVTIIDGKTGAGQDALLTRTWKVPPTFRHELTRMQAGPVDPFSDKEPAPENVRSLMEVMRMSGIEFGAEASVNFIPATSQLIVRATPANLDLVDQLVESIIGNMPKMIKVRVELYELPKADALKLVKHDEKAGDTGVSYEMLEEMVAAGTAKLVVSPTTMVRPGQLARAQTGTERSFVEGYGAKDGKDVPILRRVRVGSEFQVEPNIGVDGKIIDVRYSLYMSRGEPEITTRTVKGPVSGQELEVQSITVDALSLSQGVTIFDGQTVLLGTMQSSSEAEEPNATVAFLTATVTSGMR